MRRLEVSGAVRPLHGSLGVKGLTVIILTGPYLENYMCYQTRENVYRRQIRK